MTAIKSKTISAVSVLIFASAAVSANAPSSAPSATPSAAPSTIAGSRFPSAAPSVAPSSATKAPTSAVPSTADSEAPSSAPSSAPSTSSGSMVGNDRDEHGCIPSTGHSWCASLNKCVQPFNTVCPKSTPASQAPSAPSKSSFPSSSPSVAPSTSNLPGSDRDEHGCIPSAGYSWCDSLEKCIQPFNTACPTVEPTSAPIPAPTSAPNPPTSVRTSAPNSETGNDVDSNGCFASAGEVYCPEMKKCIQPSTESCPVSGTTVSLDGPTTMECSDDGRCDISGDDCDIQPSGESYTLGGLYLTDLSGTYEIPDGCSATCSGCVEDNDGSAASSVPTGVFAAAVVVAVAQIVLV